MLIGVVYVEGLTKELRQAISALGTLAAGLAG